MAESQQAALRARLAFGVTHNPPLDRDTEFVEMVLERIHGEVDQGRLLSGPPVTFVRWNFNSGTAAALGPPISKAAPLTAGTIYLCGDQHARCHTKANGATIGEHDAVATSGAYVGQTSVTFNPTNRHVVVRCATLGVAGPLLLDLAAPASGWTVAHVGATLNQFHAKQIDGTSLQHLLFDGNRLRPGARTRYRNALYIYLRFVVGLEKHQGYKVLTTPGRVVVRDPHNGKIAIAACGFRTGRSDVEQSKSLQRYMIKVATENPVSGGGLVLNCLACNDASSTAPACGHLTLDHRHPDD